MKHKFIIRAAAWNDLLEMAEYIARDNLEAAFRFKLNAIDEIRFLTRMPGAGAVYALKGPQFRGIRKWAIKGFPNHLIFYFKLDRHVDIVRVIHAARDIESALAEF